MKTNKLALLSAMAYTFSCDISRYYGASIQGHYVFAYSRKDAIKRLKHQKKI